MPRPSRSVRRALASSGCAAALLVVGCTSGAPGGSPGSGTPQPTTATASDTAPATQSSTTAPRPSPGGAAPQPAGQVTLLQGLDVPWSIAVLPDGTALVSERNTGRIYHVPKPGTTGTAHVVGRLPISRTEGEGGLLGLAVPVDFDANPVFYAYYSTDSDNRVAAFPWRGDSIGDPTVVLSGIPRGNVHNGGRIAFGPDGYLYIGTGEAGDTSLSQNLSSLGGKILRVTPEGAPAPGNPFGGSAIWSYGHRNVQGLVWDSRKRLWASEFGASTWDELNLIRAGDNYGWPTIEGKADNPEFVDPVAQWPTSVMSPSGIDIGPDGAVYLAALRGQSVWRVPLNADGTAGTPTRHLQGVYGRIRDIKFVGGRAWLLTSNGTNDRLLSLPVAAVGVQAG